MSWQFNGREYHDFNSYVGAINDDARARGARFATTLRERSDAYQRDIESNEKDVRKFEKQLLAGENRAKLLHKIEQLNADTAKRIEWLNDVKRQLGETQVSMDMEIRNRIAAFSACLADTKENVAQLEKAQERIVAETKSEFAEVRSSLDAGLQDAERRRREGEQRLQGQLDNLDAGLKRERQERLARISDQKEQAESLLSEARDLLAQFDQSDLQRASLAAQFNGISNAVLEAERHIELGNHEAALSQAQERINDAHTLEREMMAVLGRIDAEYGTLCEKIATLEGVFSQPDVSFMFAPQVAAAYARLETIKVGAEGRRSDRIGWDSEYTSFERDVKALEQSARAMHTTASDARAMNKERIGPKLKAVLDELQPEFQGRLVPQGKVRFPVGPDGQPDRTGTAVIDVAVEGTDMVLAITMHLDGSFTIDVSGAASHGQQANALTSSLKAAAQALLEKGVELKESDAPTKRAKANKAMQDHLDRAREGATA